MGSFEQKRVFCVRDELSPLRSEYHQLVVDQVKVLLGFGFSQAAVDCPVSEVLGNGSADVSRAEEETATEVFVGLNNDERVIGQSVGRSDGRSVEVLLQRKSSLRPEGRNEYGASMAPQ